MDPTTQSPAPGAAPGAVSTPGQSDLVGLATELAQAHGAGAGPAGPGPGPVGPGPNKGGRRAFAVELEDYCRKHGLNVVAHQGGQEGQNPGGLAPDPGAGPGTGPGGESYTVRPEFVRDLAKTGLEAVQAWRQRAFYLKALAVGCDKAAAMELADVSGAPPGCIETVAASMEELARKYAWATAYSPEIAIVVALGTWAVKDLSTLRRLEAIAKQASAGQEEPKK
jgi:hypothetical protein